MKTKNSYPYSIFSGIESIFPSVLLILFILPFILFSQEPENISELRHGWFMGQRGFPNGNTVPDSAYYNAIMQKTELLDNYGPYYPNSSWNFLGPQPLIAHPSIGTEVSGKVSIAKFDHFVQDGSRFYVGGADGGLLVTTDRGSSWTALTDNLSSLSSGAFAIKPNEQNVLLFGTGVGDCWCV